MSTITSQDMHPGRCRNFRWDPEGEKMLRCLDYEAVEHVCDFGQEPKSLIERNMKSTSYDQYQTQRPQPWVKP